MPVNTASKRLSLISFQRISVPAIPLPDGVLSGSDKQHLLWCYSGISWTIRLYGLMLEGKSKPTKTIECDSFKGGGRLNFIDKQPYIGSKGITIRLNYGESLAGAIKKEIHFKKPDGTIITKTADIYNNNYLEYTVSESSFFDIQGKWRVWIYIENDLPGFTGDCGANEFMVKEVGT